MGHANVLRAERCKQLGYMQKARSDIRGHAHQFSFGLRQKLYGPYHDYRFFEIDFSSLILDVASLNSPHDRAGGRCCDASRDVYVHGNFREFARTPSEP